MAKSLSFSFPLALKPKRDARMVSLCWFSMVHTGHHLQITTNQWMLKKNAENDRVEKCKRKSNSHLHKTILYQRSWLKALKFYGLILWPYKTSSFMPFLTDSWCVLFMQGLSDNPFLRAHKQNPTFTLSQHLLQSPTYRFPQHNCLSKNTTYLSPGIDRVARLLLVTSPSWPSTLLPAPSP